MTKKDFILQTVINLVNNPVFMGTENDGDEDFPCLKFSDICDNARGLADWLEDEEGIVFDEEGN